ncbi:lipocalin-like domain-containing protein [Patulibacter sp. NPDC049589]|uniref:lipocalin-like domain-containing protein n=1 Tax=Patulibacter sp. NPDC049589 TaxID=3154731 RepID=UPI003424726B
MPTTTTTPVTITFPDDQGSTPGVGAELWWVAARLRTADDRVFWFHHCIVNATEPEPGVVGWTSIREDATQRHWHETFQEAPGATTFAGDHLDIRGPRVTIAGDLEELTVATEAPGASSALTLRPAAPVLYSCGVGSFPLFGTTTFQYSVPAVPTAGTLTVDGEVLEVQGEAWFDRQWFMSALPVDEPLIWFGICLDNGENLSLFDTTPNGKAWVTAGHPDGSHTVSAIAPLRESQEGELINAETGTATPERWTVRIPVLDAELHLTQRVMHENPILYTGSLEVTGTWAGEPVSGYGFIDLPGPGA